MAMDFERLQDFIAVATHLHFGRAAVSRGIDQSALSRSIRRLEESLGVALFERSSRRVVLTAGGSAFLPDAKRLVHDALRAEHLLQQIAAGEHRPLRVGFAGPATFERLPRAVRQFSQRYPKMELRLQELVLDSGPELLHRGELDLCFILRTRNDRDGLDGLSTQTLQHLHFQAALPAAWPLARRRRLQLRDLADLPLIFPPREHATKVVDATMLACADAGFVPRVVQEVWQAVTVLAFVAAGVGAALMVESGRALGMAGVRFAPVTDLPAYLDMELLAVWNPRLVTAPLLALVESMKTV